MFEKTQVLKLAGNLLTKNPSELCFIALSNPALIREWIDELERWREQSRRDVDALHEATEKLSAVQRLAMNIAAA